MRNVYILIKHLDHEDRIVGAFSNMEKAEIAKQEFYEYDHMNKSGPYEYDIIVERVQ